MYLYTIVYAEPENRTHVGPFDSFEACNLFIEQHPDLGEPEVFRLFRPTEVQPNHYKALAEHIAKFEASLPKRQ